MRALIVYESMFGNTRDIARAIAAGLTPTLPTDVVEVGQAPPFPDHDVDLLIVGAPMHIFGLSTPRTRAAVANRAGHPVDPGPIGLREWLRALPPAPPGSNALTFDTRLRTRAVPGSAAKAAAKRLRKRGYRILWPSQSFHTGNSRGPSGDRDIERAQLWGRWIGGGIEVRESRMQSAVGLLEDDGTGAVQ